MRDLGPLPVSDAAAWAFGFLGREWRLAAPIALAFLALPALASQSLRPAAAQSLTDPNQVAAEIVRMLPVLLIGLFGGLGLTALAANPGGSVAEALRTAARRYGPLLLALGLVFLVLVATLSLFSLVGTLLGVDLARLVEVARFAALAAVLIAAARLLPLLPVMVVERLGPAAALRRSAALTRGHLLRLVGLVMLMTSVGLLLTLIAAQVIGSLALLLGRATEQPELFRAIGMLLLALVGAGVSTVGYVLVVGVYRGLTRR